jgi:hypothetical protein
VNHFVVQLLSNAITLNSTTQQLLWSSLFPCVFRSLLSSHLSPLTSHFLSSCSTHFFSLLSSYRFSSSSCSLHSFLFSSSLLILSLLLSSSSSSSPLIPRVLFEGLHSETSVPLDKRLLTKSLVLLYNFVRPSTERQKELVNNPEGHFISKSILQLVIDSTNNQATQEEYFDWMYVLTSFTHTFSSSSNLSPLTH